MSLTDVFKYGIIDYGASHEIIDAGGFTNYVVMAHIFVINLLLMYLD